MSPLENAYEVIKSVQSIILDKDQVIEKVMVCFLANGHVLIEDVPGVGKTTMVKAFARSMGLSFNRIQFTPDLMPSDITGVTVFSRNESSFTFRRGPVFCQFLLADEINRTSPKTQSSLLQAMEEGQVSVDDTTYTLDKPFMVLATQNPLEYQGTFPLPEAQLDRFLMRVSIGYPCNDKEIEVIKNYKKSRTLESIFPVAGVREVLEMQREAEAVFVSPDVLQYIVSIVAATRTSADIHLGASPRASIDLCRSARALAYLRGRHFVLPDDVKELVPSVLCHRVTLSAEARMESKKTEKVMDDILKRVYIPTVNAPHS